MKYESVGVVYCLTGTSDFHGYHWARMSMVHLSSRLLKHSLRFSKNREIIWMWPGIFHSFQPWVCQSKFNICVRCDMAFIEPMHRNKPNITYLLQPWVIFTDAMSINMSKINGNSIVCSTACSFNNKANTKTQHEWPFVRGIHHWLVDSLTKGPVMQKAKCSRSGWWLGAKLQYLQCISNGDTAVLH